MQPISRHLCFIYEGEPIDHLPRIFSILSEKLEAGYRCMYLGNPESIARGRTLLGSIGVRVEKELERGALVLSSEQSCLENGLFNTQKMLKSISDSVDAALRDGFAGLWGSGDMTWEFGAEKNLDKLLEYECGLEQLFLRQPKLSGICQYHRDTLPLHSLGDALLTHPSLYINHTLHRANPFYRPHDLILSPGFQLPEDATIQQMLSEFRPDPLAG